MSDSDQSQRHDSASPAEVWRGSFGLVLRESLGSSKQAAWVAKARPSHVGVSPSHTAFVDRVTAEVVEALREAGVRPILLKGPALARWLYDESHPRPYRDTDLLVAPDHSANAEQTLTRLGFRLVHDVPRGRRSAVRSHWERSTDAAKVDLLLSLPGVRVDPGALWSVLAGETETMLVGGLAVDVLNQPARALHVVLTAHRFLFLYERTLEDLARALARLDAEDWHAAASLAARLQATPTFATGLRLVPPGEAIAARMGLPDDGWLELAVRMSDAPPPAIGFLQLLRTRGLRAKTAFFADRVVPPPEYMREAFSLARRGRTGLLLAYLWRPFYLARHAPASVRAWRSAVKAPDRH
jgi:hypothetical protein